MKLTAAELSTINEALSVNKDGNLKTYPFSELSVVTSISEKLQTLLDNENNHFEDGDIELNTTEKAFVLKSLDREWSVARAKFVLTLSDKLEGEEEQETDK